MTFQPAKPIPRTSMKGWIGSGAIVPPPHLERDTWGGPFRLAGWLFIALIAAVVAVMVSSPLWLR